MRSSNGIGRQEYRLFGLAVRSEVPLPDLLPATEEQTPDVVIRLGSIEDVERRPGLYKSADGLLLVVAGVGRYAIGHDEIVVEPEAGVPEPNLRLYLLGSAFGALLHQRGLLPLHANAVEIGGSAFAFMGESGSGKSTLAAWFHDRGHAVLADDVCVVRFMEGRPFVSPGIARLRLWTEALNHSGRDASGLSRSYVGHDELDEKFDVPVDSAGKSREALPLTAIYLLRRSDDFAVSQLEGVDAADAIFANTYRGAFIGTIGSWGTYWHACIELLRSTPVFQLSRPWNLGALDTVGRQILGHACSLNGSDGAAIGHDERPGRQGDR